MSRKPLTDEAGEVRDLNREDFANMRPASEMVPEVVEAYRRSRGRPKIPTPKISTTIRLDPDVLQFFRAEGKGWQTRINNALREYVESRK